MVVRYQSTSFETSFEHGGWVQPVPGSTEKEQKFKTQIVFFIVACICARYVTMSLCHYVCALELILCAVTCSGHRAPCADHCRLLAWMAWSKVEMPMETNHKEPKELKFLAQSSVKQSKVLHTLPRCRMLKESANLVP